MLDYSSLAEIQKKSKSKLYTTNTYMYSQTFILIVNNIYHTITLLDTLKTINYPNMLKLVKYLLKILLYLQAKSHSHPHSWTSSASSASSLR